MKNKKILMLSTAGLIGATLVLSGGYFIYKKINVMKSEKLALIQEQEKLREEERLAQEAAKRKEYLENSYIAHLTFDDGPNSNTLEILDVLKENNIKATFFMVGAMVEKNPQIVKRIYEEGHTIANHTTSHKYRYSSEEEFIADIEDTDAKISKALGIEHKSLFVRMPGGSFGKTMQKDALVKNNYIDMNWTALNGDSEKSGKVDSEYLLQRIEETVGDNQYEVVLMHDIKTTTAENLQLIINAIIEKGYVFEPLTEEMPCVQN